MKKSIKILSVIALSASSTIAFAQSLNTGDNTIEAPMSGDAPNTGDFIVRASYSPSYTCMINDLNIAEGTLVNGESVGVASFNIQTQGIAKAYFSISEYNNSGKNHDAVKFDVVKGDASSTDSLLGVSFMDYSIAQPITITSYVDGTLDTTQEYSDSAMVTVHCVQYDY